ncbi:MAG TPA: HAMP domain-containing sensor histidine kinase [Candidatus Lumbricidophila sp.]|nr:HAMP domain-containing sensor histidine kinase [Candidatus Lumbricidophila sp.]
MSITSPQRPSGPSVRVRLALSYAGFLIVAGIALFVVGLLALRFVPVVPIYTATGAGAPTRGDLTEVFVRYAWWTLGGLIAFGLIGGWLLAGRMLRPLHRITDTVRRVRDGELDHRIALAGRRDELTELADAFDAMLDRVQHTLDEERRFAANASHELRTPHAIIRTMVEVARADQAGRDVDEVLRRVAATNDRSIAITESLLALARAGRGGSLERAPIDLAAITAAVVSTLAAQAETSAISIHTSLAPAVTLGHRTLIEQLVTNLLTNAIAHNTAGGRVVVTTAALAGSVELSVTNTGAVLPPELVETLTEPFVRAAGRTRAESGAGGVGLGLAIVASTVRAHGGTLELSGRAEGGLHVRVHLPAAAGVSGSLAP